MAKFNIVLHEPEIPSNTGNIGRTCVAAGAALHLIEPLGFKISGKAIRRAGMDYWNALELYDYIDYQDFQTAHSEDQIYYATTKGGVIYSDVSFEDGCYIMFGKESAGIPESILRQHPERCIRIPMLGETRSLNLANSVAVVLYEALRQHGFEGMKTKGHFRET